MVRTCRLRAPLPTERAPSYLPRDSEARRSVSAGLVSGSGSQVRTCGLSTSASSDLRPSILQHDFEGEEEGWRYLMASAG